MPLTGDQNARHAKSWIARRGIMIDRLDSMRVFVTALNEGSLARAAQRLRRSPD